MMLLLLLLSLLAASLGTAAAAPVAAGWMRPGSGEIAFAKAYGDHMVLAAAPAKSSVWGYGPPGTTVKVAAASEAAAVGGTAAAVVAEAQVEVKADGTWKAFLPPVSASATAHTITASAVGGQKSAALHDVLFGAVWVCGGQVRCAIMQLVAPATAQIVSGARLSCRSQTWSTPQARSQRFPGRRIA
jgi:hypothetical protein